MGDDDLDLYGRGAAPSRAGVTKGLARVLGALVGAAVSFCGVVLYALRCFDYCPEDPSLDKSLRLLSAALVLFGLVVAIAALSAGTRRGSGAAAVAAALGAAIALCGIATLALAPSIDSPPEDPAGTALGGGIALVAGAAVAAAALYRRRHAPRPRD